MAEERVQRRLAAILAADVVGYSRLMGEDEAGTLARLKAHREDLVEPEVAVRQGRIVKLMGDGILIEFANVVDAVACAVAIQRGMAERTIGLPLGLQLIGRAFDEETEFEFAQVLEKAASFEALPQFIAETP